MQYAIIWHYGRKKLIFFLFWLKSIWFKRTFLSTIFKERYLCASELSRSVVSNSLRPHGLQSAGLLCPWSFPGKNTKVDCHFLFQGIFLIQGSNPHLLSFLLRQAGFWPLSHRGSPMVLVWEPTKTALEQHTCKETSYMTEVSLYIYEEMVNILVDRIKSVALLHKMFINLHGCIVALQCCFTFFCIAKWISLYILWIFFSFRSPHNAK